jgi:hypothetical protein
VPQPTAPPRTPPIKIYWYKIQQDVFFYGIFVQHFMFVLNLSSHAKKEGKLTAGKSFTCRLTS